MAGIVEDMMDGKDEVELLFNIVDPLSYMDRLEKIPKLIMISSDDEFMQFDWTNIWYEKMRGETHIDIVANSEHSMITGILPSLSNIGTFVRSIASGKTGRPTFDYKYDEVTGQISITLPKSQVKPIGVYLRHG